MALHLGWKYHKAAAYQHLIFVGKTSLLRSVVKWYLNYLCDIWITYGRGYALMDTILHNDTYCADIWLHYWHLIYLLGYQFHLVDICTIFFSLFGHLIPLLTFELPNFRIPLILWTLTWKTYKYFQIILNRENREIKCCIEISIVMVENRRLY